MLARRFLLCLAVAVALDAWFVHAARERAGGVLCPTTDDAFIHMQYARSFAELRPLSYQPGEAPTTGATSLLYAMLVALGFPLGLDGMEIVWFANAVSVLALALGMTAAWSFAARVASPRAGPGAAFAFVACPTFALLAFGCMEVGVSTCAHFAAAAAAVTWWLDPSLRDGAPGVRRAFGLAALAALAAIGRPEGLASAIAVAATLLARPPTARPLVGRALALLAPLPWLVPPVVALATSGTPSTTGALVKLLPADPFRPWAEMQRIAAWNTQNVLARLFTGDTVGNILVYPALPRATYAFVAIGALGLARAFVRRGGKDGWGALATWLLACSAILAVLAYTWIGNMGRYALAFAPLAIVTSSLGAHAIARELAERIRLGARARGVVEALVPLAVSAAFVVVPARAVQEHASASSAICGQQVEVARRVRALPDDAVVAVNDAGAITFLGEHRTWDLVGLTSPGAALPHLSGAGSVFERLERLPRGRRPTHYAIYPEWFPGFGALGTDCERVTAFGPYVGGATKHLCTLAPDAIGSGAAPAPAPPGMRVVDAVDVADLASEREHRWASTGDGPTPRSELRRHRLEGRWIVDGARKLATGDRASLAATPGRPARLITRLVAPRSARLRIAWNGRSEEVSVPRGAGFREVSIPLAEGDVRATNALERTVLAGEVLVAHDFLLQ